MDPMGNYLIRSTHGFGHQFPEESVAVDDCLFGFHPRVPLWYSSVEAVRPSTTRMLRQLGGFATRVLGYKSLLGLGEHYFLRVISMKSDSIRNLSSIESDIISDIIWYNMYWHVFSHIVWHFIWHRVFLHYIWEFHGMHWIESQWFPLPAVCCVVMVTCSEKKTGNFNKAMS